MARLEFAEILLSGIHDPVRTCVHRCGWSSKYAYAYLKLLKTQDLWPRAMSGISVANAILKAEMIPDAVPDEASQSCPYSYKHSVPEYRRNRHWNLSNLDSKTGLCLHCIRYSSQNAVRCQIEH